MVMQNQAPIRIGVVGIGFGQHVHVPAFRRDVRVRVDAICASGEARAAAVAERLSIPRVYGDWRAMVDDPELDGLSLSVPPHVQAEVALATVRAGKHLFAEKPLATCTAEAKAIVDTAKATGSVGAVDFEFRVTPAWLKAKEIIERGQLGRLRRVFMSWRIETFAYRTNQRTWKRDASGGVLNLFVSHSFDSVEWLFGRVRRLAARLEPATGADARAEVWLELEDGLHVSISAAADLAGGSGHRVEVYGDDGALFLENISNDYIAGFTAKTVSRKGQATVIELPQAPPGEDGRVTAVAEVVRRFVDAIESHGPMRPGLEDGLAVQRLVDLARDAHRSGTWLS
jgi:predicted dehydrogenase